MVARGNLQARQRRLEDRLTGLDPKVLAVYERMYARELAYRKQIFNECPAVLVNQIADRSRPQRGRAYKVAMSSDDVVDSVTQKHEGDRHV